MRSNILFVFECLLCFLSVARLQLSPQTFSTQLNFIAKNLNSAMTLSAPKRYEQTKEAVTTQNPIKSSEEEEKIKEKLVEHRLMIAYYYPDEIISGQTKPKEEISQPAHSTETTESEIAHQTLNSYNTAYAHSSSQTEHVRKDYPFEENKKFDSYTIKPTNKLYNTQYKYIEFLLSILSDTIPEEVVRTTSQLLSYDYSLLQSTQQLAKNLLDEIHNLSETELDKIDMNQLNQLQRSIVLFKSINLLMNQTISDSHEKDLSAAEQTYNTTDSKNNFIALPFSSSLRYHNDSNFPQDFYQFSSDISAPVTLSDQIKKKSYFVKTFYLSTLHMETVELSPSFDKEVYKKILFDDVNVVEVKNDKMVKCCENESFSTIIGMKGSGEIQTGDLTSFDSAFLKSEEQIAAQNYNDPDILAKVLKFHGENYLMKQAAANNALLAEPNDPFFMYQWPLQSVTNVHGSINFAELFKDPNYQRWAMTLSHKKKTTVAIIDSGFDLFHPDLQGQLWINQDEICGNNIDDDENGYVDDCFGWNFVGNRNIPNDDTGHGTVCAGIIAALPQNSIGITPTCWNCDIMALKIFGSTLKGSILDAVQATDYALKKKIRVSNHSYGGQILLNEELLAITRAQKQELLVISASGNESQDFNTGELYHPSALKDLNVISVAATFSNGHLTPFSNYGSEWITIAAPGMDIVSTTINGYSVNHGTSFSSPHVAGTLAHIISAFPEVTYQQLIDGIHNISRPVPALSDVVVTKGIVDIYLAHKFFQVQEINECLAEEHPCPPQAGVRCLKFPGTYECRCPEDYFWIPRVPKICIRSKTSIFEPCRSNVVCGANSLCYYNMRLGPTCRCVEGYVKHSSGNFCVPEGLQNIDPTYYLELIKN